MHLNLTSLDIDNINNKLQQATSICITAHQNPDGDAVGSTLGLYWALKEKGLNCNIILPDAVPEYLQWLPGTNDIIIAEENLEKAKSHIQHAQVLFCLDYNAPLRTGEKLAAAIESTEAFKIMLDHHPQPENFCDITINEPSESSTCQLVVKFLHTQNWQNYILEKAATCLYTGLVTDTGSFKFSCTTAITHEIAGFLINRGAKNALIHDLLFDTANESRLRIIGYALYQKLVIWYEHHTAYICLTKDEMHSMQVSKGDTEGLVNFGLSIKGVKLAAIFIEKDDKIKISFRSKGKVPANTLMSLNFTGGGHLNAAGGISNLSMQDTLTKFMEVIPPFMHTYGEL